MRVIAKLVLTTLICAVLAVAAQEISGIWSIRRAVQLTDEHRVENGRLRQQLAETNDPVERALIRRDAREANRLLSQELESLQRETALRL